MILIIPHKIPEIKPNRVPLLNEKIIKGTDCPRVTVPPKGSLHIEIKFKIVHNDITTETSDKILILKFFI